jgi:Spy/CpxP family protein refolding chaperone
MKKTAFTLLAITIMAFMAYNVFAQDNNPGTNPNDDNMRPGFMGMGKMMRNRGPEMVPGQMGPGAMGQMMPDGKGFGMFRPDMMEKIGFTKEQKDTIQNMHSSHRKDMIRNNADLQLAEVDLQDMLRKDKPDMNLVKGQIQKIVSIRGDIEFAKIKMQMDLKGILTDEQKAKLEKIMQDQKAMMKDNIKQGKQDKRGANANRPGPMNNQMNNQMNRQMDNRPMNQPNPNNEQPK